MDCGCLPCITKCILLFLSSVLFIIIILLFIIVFFFVCVFFFLFFSFSLVHFQFMMSLKDFLIKILYLVSCLFSVRKYKSLNYIKRFSLFLPIYYKSEITFIGACITKTRQCNIYRDF